MSEPQQQPMEQQPSQLVSLLGEMLGQITAVHTQQTATNRRHLEALQNQAGKQNQLLEGLLARSGAQSPSSPPSSFSGITMHRMTAADDPQTFLEMFEATAEACGWPAAEWAVRLLPLLSGESQTAALGLPASSRGEFRNIKRAILDRMGFSPEDHRRRFRSAALGPSDRPFVYAQQLKDAATRWLQPGGSAGERQMLEQVVLEQFVEGLPTGTAEWVRCHRPADLEAAVTLAEDHLAVHDGDRAPERRPSAPTRPVPAPRRRPPPPLTPRLGTFARPPPLPRINQPSALSPSQGPATTGAALDPQRVPRTSGQECWRCGQPGHFRRECPLMEVGQTDASNRGLGAVLSQQVQGVDRPVLYISRKLSERESRYSTIEKECLAIRWAVEALRYYLLGRSFTLCSDHAPLQWLHRMKDANARITRWYLALQPFKFRVIHRPGAQMAVADFLSRSFGEGGGSGLGRMAPRPKSGGGGMWGWAWFALSCRREVWGRLGRAAPGELITSPADN
ncbi:uncharacterized protein LOC118332359 [Morone saxatilis]|uniref:uncharacterized protein LOC118332359 n=1 Tax=Morone saxatilis TaxID=34816 RepID=UPI0015E2485C|nr:uncharacterized protein LOC118332359 [Morone saxatilis]